LFISGITGVFSIVESVAGNFEVEFKLSRIQAVATAIIIMLLLSVFFCMGNGTYILGALTPMVMGYTFLIGGIAQIIAFMYVDKSLAKDPVFIATNNKTSIMFYIAKYFGLAFLIFSLVGALHDEFAGEFNLAHKVRWGWFLCILAISIWGSLQKTSNERSLW
jgi:NSS family neurotransmitter:Na+ symporter